MRTKYAQRLFAGLMSISLVFQNCSVTSFAAEQPTQTEALENTETAFSETESEDMEENIPEVGGSNLEEPGETNEDAAEASETEDAIGAENPESEEGAIAEDSEKEESTADEDIETGQDETEKTGTIEDHTDGENSDELGEFYDVSVKFDGYYAILNAEYTLSSNGNSAEFYLVSYDENGEEITDTSIYASKDADSNYYSISRQSIALYKTAQSLKIKAVEFDKSGLKIDRPVFSTELIRTKIPDIKFTVDEPKAEAGRVIIPLSFDGNMYHLESEESYSFLLKYTLKYGINNIDEKSSSDHLSFSGENGESLSIIVNDLEAETTYHAQLLIEIEGSDNELGNVYEQTVDLPDFTTSTDEVYNLELAFPDKIFREIIRRQLSLEASETTVKKSQLENIISLYADRNDITTDAIKDIQGIELLYNITWVEIRGHEITDISSIEWEKLPELCYLDLRGNCIEALPDFAKNATLKSLYISNNYIPSTEILNLRDKLPEGCECWDYYQRQKDFKLTLENKYYQANGKSEIALKVQGYNGWFSHVFKTYIDGNQIDLESCTYIDEDGYYYLILYNRDISYEIGTHAFRFEMYEGSSEKLVTTEEATFEIVQECTLILDNNFWQPTDIYYMSAQQEYLSVRTYSTKEVSEIYLVKDNLVYGKSIDLNSGYGWIQSINRYPNLGNYTSECSDYETSTTLYMNKKQIPTGLYDLKLVYKDGTEERLGRTVEVVKSAIITGISAGGSYDHTGEYLYLVLSADYLDPSRINYTIKDYNNRALETEYIDCKPISGGYVVKLKKIGWNRDVTDINVYLSGTEDYPLYVATSSTYCYIEDILYFGDYNYQSNMLEVGITSQVDLSDCTYSIVRTDLPWDFSTEHIREEYTARLEKVEDTIYNVIPRWEEKDCTLYGGYYQFSILRSEDSSALRSFTFYVPGRVVERVRRITDNGYWDATDYNLVQQGIGNITRFYFSEIEYVEGNTDDFSAQITGGSLTNPLDAQSLWTYNHSSDTYKTAIGMDFDPSSLGIGHYTIELYYRNSLLSTYELQVIEKDIFVLYDYVYVSWNSEDTFYVSFYTPNCGESDDYDITLTDINGNEVEVLTITDLYKGNSYISFIVSGLKKSEADKRYYIKLLHKTKGAAYCKDLTTKYYSGYGKYTEISDYSKYGWNDFYMDGMWYGYTGIWQDDPTIFPATFTIYKFNSTESIYSTVLTEDDFDGSYYYFTQDLIDILPRADGYYHLVLIGNSGQFLSAERTQIGLNSDILNSFRVDPPSMTLQLGVERESSKTITALNATETPTFESDDTTIATVTVSEDDHNVATVEAVDIGRTSITVISGGNIKKVTVVVTEPPVAPDSIQFSQETITAVEGMPINATVNVEPEKAWTSSSKITYSSSDENIVSVGDSTTRNITLTAKNPGSATITAELKGTELSAQCTVTVTPGLTAEEKSELISSVGNLYFFADSENTLGEVSLPQGWRWANPSQKPTADSDRPSKEFTAIYTKDGLDYFMASLPVFVTNVRAKITGATTIQTSAVETYNLTYDYIGYKPTDDTISVSSIQWTGDENLIIQGESNKEEVTVQAGETPGRYELQCTLTVKNTESGKTLQNTFYLSINIKDYTEEIIEAARSKTYYFLSGADTNLNDIPIGDDWSWVWPNKVPGTDDSIRTQSFAAQYTTKNGKQVSTLLSVAVSALEEVTIEGASKVGAEKNGSYKLYYRFSGYDINDTDGYDISYQWKGSEGFTIDGDADSDMVTIKTGNTPGNYTLTAEVIVTNKQTGNTAKMQGSFPIQILDKDSVDSIDIRPANQQPEKALACVISNGALESDYAAFNKKNSFRIQLVADTTASGVAKAVPVLWASSDKKVASIDSFGLVTVKKAGITVISAASTDKGEYSEEIVLKIQDFTPALDKKSLSVSQYSAMGTEIGLTAQNGNQIQSVEVSASGLSTAENRGIWYLKASGYSKKTVENTTLKILTDRGEYVKSLKVTVSTTLPKATLKQSIKPNIFYDDATAVYKVTSKYAIERIEDASGTSETCFHVKDYDVQAGILTLEPYDITENIEIYKAKNSNALNAKIYVFFEGYADPIPMTVKVKVQNKKPSLRINTATLIKDTGMDEALTAVLNGRSVYDLTNAMVYSTTENVAASVSGGKLRLNYSGSSNTTYKVDIQDENWTQAVTVSGKIQMVNADTLGLEAETTKVTVNKANLSPVIIPVAVKGNSALEPKINIEYDSSALTAAYKNGSIEINVLQTAQDKTYKVEVGGVLDVAGRKIDVKKAVVKITVTSKQASVKLFASGKINIADRTYSSTTYTPTLKNMDANIIGAEVTGDSSEYFYAYLDETDKVVLKAISGKPLKANVKYTVDITTSFDNGYKAVTKVNIKPVNKLPKVKASLSKGTLYKSGADSRIGIQLTLDVKYRISQVKLGENSNSGYFTLTQDESGLVAVALSENGLKIPSGTYTVPYQILIADADNTKPITLKLKITVK